MKCQFFILNLNDAKKLPVYIHWEDFPKEMEFYGVSIPYFSLFLFSLDIFLKFLTLCVFSRNIKNISVIDGDAPLIFYKFASLALAKFVDEL